LLAIKLPGAREAAMKVPGETDYKCPKCSDIMIISQVEGIEIEKCIGCRGIFLDADEIDKIRKQLRQQGVGTGWGLGFIVGLSAPN
jgi:hypothetical protein